MNQTQIPSYLLPPQTIREKTAFLFHSPELIYHFGPVLEQFAPSEVDLIVYNYRRIPDLSARLKELPFQVYDVQELLPERIGYRYLVSNHYQGYIHTSIPGPQGLQLVRSPLITCLAQKNVRFLYGMGVDQCYFTDDSNLLYDAFLCFGPWQAKGLSHYPGKKLLMGYPRYDHFFHQNIDRATWLKKLNCDPQKQTIVWFTTSKTAYGTLNIFAESLSQLTQEYNLIVKPHPEELENTEYLEQYGFTSIIRDYIDNLILYQLSDFILSDYGGIIYSALYTDRPILLLDHPDYQSQTTEDVAVPDTDLWVRQYLTHLSLSESEQISDLLKSEIHWQEQKKTRQWLREQFFTPAYGHAGELAAQYLRDLDSLLSDQLAATHRLQPQQT